MLMTTSASSGFMAQMFTTAGPSLNRFFSDIPPPKRSGVAEGENRPRKPDE